MSHDRLGIERSFRVPYGVPNEVRRVDVEPVSAPGRVPRAGGRAGPPPTTAVAAGDDATAAVIIAAAVEMMSSHGYHGTSVRDIAEAAGVSAGALYHHFGSKHDLLVTILDRGMDRLVHRTEDALFHAGDDPADRLRAIVEVHVLAHAVSRRESLIGNSELRSLSPQAAALIIAKRDTQQRMFDRVVEDGVRRGVFTTSHPAEASRFIVSACTAVAGWFNGAGELPAQEIAARYQRIALDTVGHRGER
jgi:AcrR family transcriptional regulator